MQVKRFTAWAHWCCGRKSLAKLAALSIASVLSLGAQAKPGDLQPLALAPPKRCQGACATLYRYLMQLPPTHTLVGHQNTTATGVRWQFDADRSDIKDITGRYPAVFGWDLGMLEEGARDNLDGIPFAFIQRQVQLAHSLGAITTFSWHLTNPVAKGSAWTEPVDLRELLPGGRYHGQLTKALDNFAAFNRTLTYTTASGKDGLIPVILRPWHEHNGDWFWWGISARPQQEAAFKSLWRFCVEYLSERHRVRNVLYAYSPDRSRITPAQFEQHYFYGYPGDQWVDILGLDDYWDLGHVDNPATLAHQAVILRSSLEWLRATALLRNKIAALTETGEEAVPRNKFWSEVMLPPLTQTSTEKAIAYFMLWRNANYNQEHRYHFYAPYAEHPSAADFLEVFAWEETLFTGDLVIPYDD